MDVTVLPAFVLSFLAGCSAIAGCIAYNKRRSPLEGVLLGFFLGPIGVLLELRHAYVQRPPVDQPAWNSLRSMVNYQSSGRGSRRDSNSSD